MTTKRPATTPCKAVANYLKKRVIYAELLPCPFCGGDSLFAGVMSSDSYGVQCWRVGEGGCGASLIRRVPDKWPKGIWKRSRTADENLLALHEWVFWQAANAWNTRQGQNKKSTKVIIYG